MVKNYEDLIGLIWKIITSQKEHIIIITNTVTTIKLHFIKNLYCFVRLGISNGENSRISYENRLLGNCPPKHGNIEAEI